VVNASAAIIPTYDFDGSVVQNDYSNDWTRIYSPGTANSSLINVNGPIATPSQLLSVAQVNDHRALVPVVSTCQRRALVSSSRLINGVCISIDVTSDRTMSGFWRECVEWREIIILPTLVVVGILPVPLSHSSVTGIEWSFPPVFVTVILPAQDTTAEAMAAPIATKPSTQTSPAFAVAVYSPCATRPASNSQRVAADSDGCHPSSTSSRVVYTTVAAPTFKALASSNTLVVHHAAVHSPRRTRDYGITSARSFNPDTTPSALPHWTILLHILLALVVITGLHKDIRRFLPANKAWERRLQKEIDDLTSSHREEMAHLRDEHAARMSERDVAAVTPYQAEVATLKDEIAEKQEQLMDAMGNYVTLSEAKRTAATSFDEERSRLLAALNVEKKRVVDLRREHETQVTTMESSLERLQTALQDAAAANRDLTREKEGTQQDLSYESSRCRLLELQNEGLVLRHSVAMEMLEQEVVNVKKGLAKAEGDTVAVREVTRELEHTNASLSVDLANRAEELRSVVAANVSLKFDLRLEALKNARLVVLEEVIRGLGGEVGCAETDVLRVAYIPEQSDEDEEIYYSHPRTPTDDDDDGTAATAITPGMAVLHDLPEASSVQTGDVKSDDLDAPIAPAIDIDPQPTTTTHLDVES
ncbi:hypothetical protein FRB98_004294, partial [Tulasnella sp. 332]